MRVEYNKDNMIALIYLAKIEREEGNLESEKLYLEKILEAYPSERILKYQIRLDSVNNLLSKKFILCICVVFVLFMFLMFMINHYEHKNYVMVSNYKINTLVGLIKEKYPDVSDKEILNILEKNVDNNTYFKQYGYDIKSDGLINDLEIANKKYMSLKVIITLIFVIILFVIIVMYYRKHDNRIDDLIETLKKVDKINYELDLEDSSEDKLSILKQDLYKISVMLKESSINSLNDKIILKESLP